MRFHLAAAIFFLAASSAAPASERNFTVTGFDRIRVDGPYHVELKTGVAPFARATGSATALDSLDVSVEGRTLIIRKSPSAWGGFPGKDPGPVRVVTGTHELGASWLNGSGTLDISGIRGLSFDLSLVGPGAISAIGIDVDRLNVALSGSGSAKLAGKARKATLSVKGTGALDASQLSVKDATAGAEGAAVLKLAAGNSAKIDAFGTATVEMSGRAPCELRTSGSVVVSGCR